MADSSDDMNWSVLSSKALVSGRKALENARNSLVQSLSQEEERRLESRLSGPTLAAKAAPSGEVLLNVSRSGIAVGISRRCAFARGEHYKVSLIDGSTRADLEGLVCWTRSSWSSDSQTGNHDGYFQAAGLEIVEPLSTDQESSWRVLRELIESGSVELDLQISPAR